MYEVICKKAGGEANQGVVVYGGSFVYGMGAELGDESLPAEYLGGGRKGGRGGQDKGAFDVPWRDAALSAS